MKLVTLLEAGWSTTVQALEHLPAAAHVGLDVPATILLPEPAPIPAARYEDRWVELQLELVAGPIAAEAAAVGIQPIDSNRSHFDFPPTPFHDLSPCRRSIC